MIELQPSVGFETDSSKLEKVSLVIEKFENDIWFGKSLFGKSVAQQVRDSQVRGHSGMAGNLDVKFFTIAGRTMITITDEESGHWVSMVVAEDSDGDKPTMGLHARSIKINLVICFIEHVINHWGGIEEDKHVMLDVLAGTK